MTIGMWLFMSFIGLEFFFATVDDEFGVEK